LARRFRGLRAEPDRSYDTVVIGAGVGGLICANLLVRAGLRVLLVEQHFMVGGYCSTFRRNGYTFDAATHFYPLLGNTSTITGALLTELGITTEWIKMDPVDCFNLPDGTRFPVSADLDAYLNRLKTEFHEEAKNIDRFFALVRKTYLIGLMRYFHNAPTDRIAPYQNLTILDALNRHFRSDKLKLLLAGDIGHWGSLPSRTSFVFDSMLRFSYFLGNYYPRGGSQAFVDELAQRFEEAGGHILMSSMVRRILVRNHSAWGVEVETGTRRNRTCRQIASGTVVSNADMLLTLERLIGPELLDPDYLANVFRLRPTLPCFLIHFGLKDISLEELRKIEGHHWSSWNMDDVATDSFKVFLPTAFDPGLAPAGGQIAIIQKLTAIDYDAVTDWSAHKTAVADSIVQYLERRLPGFSKRIVVQLNASAQTSQRYTLNHQGAMLGWQMSPAQLGDARPGVRGPLKNLYFVGHWTQPGGGITPVMVSAMQAAKLITGNTNDRALPPSRESRVQDAVGAIRV
jgi:phytoene dehydrogenase-like protein